jgi:hypothetical protein
MSGFGCRTPFFNVSVGVPWPFDSSSGVLPKPATLRSAICFANCIVWKSLGGSTIWKQSDVVSSVIIPQVHWMPTNFTETSLACSPCSFSISLDNARRLRVDFEAPFATAVDASCRGGGRRLLIDCEALTLSRGCGPWRRLVFPLILDLLRSP